MFQRIHRPASFSNLVNRFAIFGLALLLSAVATTGSATAKTMPHGAEPGWVIDETTTMLGDAKLYLTKDSFKMTVPKLHLTLISRAPDWSFIAFNSASKKYVLMDADEANSLFSFHRKKGTSHDAFPDVGFRLEDDEVLGLKTRKYLYPHASEDLHLSREEMISLADKLEHRKPLNAKDKEHLTYARKLKHRIYWMAADIPIPKQVAKIFAVDDRPYGGLLLPLRMALIAPGAKPALACQVSTIKRTTLDASNFEKPVGYARAPSQLAMLLDDGEGDSMEEALAPETVSRLKKKLSTPAQNSHQTH